MTYQMVAVMVEWLVVWMVVHWVDYLVEYLVAPKAALWADCEGMSGGRCDEKKMGEKME